MVALMILAVMIGGWLIFRDTQMRRDARRYREEQAAKLQRMKMFEEWKDGL